MLKWIGHQKAYFRLYLEEKDEQERGGLEPNLEETRGYLEEQQRSYSGRLQVLNRMGGLALKGAYKGLGYLLFAPTLIIKSLTKKVTYFFSLEKAKTKLIVSSVLGVFVPPATGTLVGIFYATYLRTVQEFDPKSALIQASMIPLSLLTTNTLSALVEGYRRVRDRIVYEKAQERLRRMSSGE
jgi:hypothetical protein